MGKKRAAVVEGVPPEVTARIAKVRAMLGPNEQKKFKLRGTGRTYRAVAAVPDGGAFIVHDWALRYYIEDVLLAQGRHPLSLTILQARHADTIERVMQYKRGMVGIDHYVHEIVPCTAKVLRAAIDALHN